MSPTRQIVPTRATELRDWRFVDLRPSLIYRRGHPQGALSLSRDELERSLFLLPPRGAPVAFLHADPAVAEEAADWLEGRGWRTTGWIDVADPVLARTMVEGAEAVALWAPAETLVREQARLGRMGRMARKAPTGRMALGASNSSRDELGGAHRARRAVDLACGSGRNSVHLARLGLDVTGLDILEDALVQARRVARTAGPLRGAVSFRRADLTTSAAWARWLRPAQWDAIIVFRYLDRAILPLIEGALAPSGLLIYETFLEEQARIHGRPRRPEFLLKPGELRASFPDLEIVDYREGPDSEDNRLATLVARRRRNRRSA